MSRIKDWLMEMEAHVFDAMERGVPREGVYNYVCSVMHGASEREVEYIIEDINKKYNFDKKGNYYAT